MSARIWRTRRTGMFRSIAGFDRFERKRDRRLRIVTRPGWGMGMGANTIIHNGGKP